jgi:hypothetical protein
VEWAEAQWSNLEYELDICPDEMDSLHQKKEEELSDHQVYQVSLHMRWRRHKLRVTI